MAQEKQRRSASKQLPSYRFLTRRKKKNLRTRPQRKTPGSSSHRHTQGHNPHPCSWIEPTLPHRASQFHAFYGQFLGKAVFSVYVLSCFRISFFGGISICSKDLFSNSKSTLVSLSPDGWDNFWKAYYRTTESPSLKVKERQQQNINAKL